MILFNLSVCQPVGGIKRHGGGIYGEIVLKRIIERKLPVYCYYNAQIWLNPDIESIIRNNGIKMFDCNELTLEEVVAKYDIDKLYTPLYIDLNDFNACKVVCTIHGLRGVETPKDMLFFKYKSSVKEKIKFIANLLFPSYFKKQDYCNMKAIADNSTLSFVTVSNHSKYGFMSYYPSLFKNRTIPVYYSPSTINPEEKICSQFHEKYFLLVSAKIWAKNNLRAIMAFDKLFSEGMLDGYNVKIAGASSASVFKYKIKNPNRFSFMGYVDDIVLRQLYKDARCLVYPSLNEGFGYPPVEAMSFGTPVIASSFTSISEICEDAAMYINPYSIEEIMNRILQMMDESNHKEYVKRSIRRYSEVLKKQREDLDALIDYIYNAN